MRLFKGQVEVRETDTIKVNRNCLRVFDKNGYMIYYENGKFWSKREFDKNGKETYYEDSNKYCVKREYDENGNQNYYENSYGTIFDNRLKEITIEELAELGYKLKEGVSK